MNVYTNNTLHQCQKNYHPTRFNTRLPKLNTLKIYFNPNHFFVNCGDIETKNGPILNLLQTRPIIHRGSQTIFFLPNKKTPTRISTSS